MRDKREKKSKTIRGISVSVIMKVLFIYSCESIGKIENIIY